MSRHLHHSVHFTVSPNTAGVTGASWLNKRWSAGDLKPLCPAHFNMPCFINESRSAADSLRMQASYSMKFPYSGTRRNGQPVSDICGSGQDQMAVSCENGNEPSGSIKRSEFITQMNVYMPLKGTALWSLLVNLCSPGTNQPRTNLSGAKYEVTQVMVLLRPVMNLEGRPELPCGGGSDADTTVP